MTQAFTYTANPGRVLFGAGTLSRLPEEITRLGLSRVLVLSTPEQAETASMIAALVGERAVGIHSHAAMHTPIAVTEATLRVVTDLAVDGLVAIGGGSTTGLGKAVALRSGLPQIAIPTTYAGSEMTPILGETEEGVKTTITDPVVLPQVVLYDTDLTLDLPPAMSAISGMNALAHAVEALYARDRNPIVTMMACDAIRALSGALPRIVASPRDAEARGDALYGAWLCGTCLGAVGMALHHKLCHVLGGSFALPHAETHAIVLPHAMAFNAPAIPDVWAMLSDVLKTEDPARALFDLGATLGVPHGLRALGMLEDAIDDAADIAMARPYWNPRPLDRLAIRALIARAWAGEPPVIG